MLYETDVSVLRLNFLIYGLFFIIVYTACIIGLIWATSAANIGANRYETLLASTILGIVILVV